MSHCITRRATISVFMHGIDYQVGYSAYFVGGDNPAEDDAGLTVVSVKVGGDELIDTLDDATIDILEGAAYKDAETVRWED